MIADSLSVATYRYPRCVRASGPGDLAAAERQGRNRSSCRRLLSTDCLSSVVGRRRLVKPLCLPGSYEPCVTHEARDILPWRLRMWGILDCPRSFPARPPAHLASALVCGQPTGDSRPTISPGGWDLLPLPSPSKAGKPAAQPPGLPGSGGDRCGE